MKQNGFLTYSWRFLRSNELEQLQFKLEKIIGIQKHAGKAKKKLFQLFAGFCGTRGTSILGEVRIVEISGVTQQLICGKSHDFLAAFALAHSKINQIA